MAKNGFAKGWLTLREKLNASLPCPLLPLRHILRLLRHRLALHREKPLFSLTFHPQKYIINPAAMLKPGRSARIRRSRRSAPIPPAASHTDPPHAAPTRPENHAAAEDARLL